MNLFDIFAEIETKDPEGAAELNNRRDMLKKFTGKTGRIALATLPFALGSMFQKAYAGAGPSTSTVLGILNYALTLEYLESQFYYMGLQAKDLIPSTEEYDAFITIGTHEKEHVAFLQTAIKSLGGTPVTSPKFDYTAGGGSGTGPLSDIFTNYETFLAAAQTFEDVGVRAYKGQAANLVKGGALLTAALDIHTVEARHASAVRQMRYARSFATIKPWITLGDPGISSAFNTEYAGEQNTLQAGVQIVDINGFNINDEAASEAFDEPLTMARVLAIVKPFIAQ
jgi:hypothetical protein